MNKKFIFGSAQECLNSALVQTPYEKERNIKVVSSKYLYETPELKVAGIKKTDNSMTMIILIKKAKHKELWTGWIPTQNQIGSLKAVIDCYSIVDNTNAIYRTARSLNG